MVDRSSIRAPQCDAATLSTTSTRRIAPGCAADGQLCHHQPVSRGRPTNFHESRDASQPRGGNRSRHFDLPSPRPRACGAALPSFRCVGNTSAAACWRTLGETKNRSAVFGTRHAAKAASPYLDSTTYGEYHRIRPRNPCACRNLRPACRITPFPATQRPASRPGAALSLRPAPLVRVRKRQPCPGDRSSSRLASIPPPPPGSTS
jgi:hypothetical protein